ncbi:Uncharacterised protein [Klebsiella pneumoniae]|nr:Uncharacterised protein [Klebsiella pneumoniae]VGE77724.1 Uncharacterised protein [Klebsiella pneumoniae]
MDKIRINSLDYPPLPIRNCVLILIINVVRTYTGSGGRLACMCSFFDRFP